jgi:CDGSH iron-sulfur domain-containing protein 3
VNEPRAKQPDQVASWSRQPLLPHSPQIGAYAVRVEEGKRYLWCSCGLSKSQPWCDGSHGDTGFIPIAFTAPMTETFHMCGCKHSQNKPYCFGNCIGMRRRIFSGSGAQ